jgi:zinc-ribbon domain
MSPEPHQDLTDAGEEQLCTSCTTPNEPSAHFCVKCGAPLSSYATFAPFERLFSEGFIYREAANHPRKLIVVFGVWLIFGTGAVAGVVFLDFSSQGAIMSRILRALLGSATIAVCGLMIWKTTRNYLARKQSDERHDG